MQLALVDKIVTRYLAARPSRGRRRDPAPGILIVIYDFIGLAIEPLNQLSARNSYKFIAQIMYALSELGAFSNRSPEIRLFNS